MTSVREVQFSRPKQKDDVVDMITAWLERAKRGEVQAIGLIGIKSDLTVSTEWCGITDGGLHQLNSGITILQHRLMIANVDG